MAPRLRQRLGISWATTILVGLLAACGGSNGGDSSFRLGFAKRDITPSIATAPPDGQVYLGGYGFGPVRKSTGVLAPIFVRAMVIEKDGVATAFAEAETQGAFVAYKNGSYGLLDVARTVETNSAGRIRREHVIIGSSHSHAGPDTTGIWGGLPESYLQYIHDQSVGAILDALEVARPTQLRLGVTPAGELLRSQFRDPPNDEVDADLRVLVAVDESSTSMTSDKWAIRGVLVNYAAHATVMGSDNTKISGDWPSVVSARLERELDLPSAVVMVADVGRTQPADGQFDGSTEEARLEGYGNAVTWRVYDAIRASTPVQPGPISGRQLYLREPYTNPFFPASLLVASIARNAQRPWVVNEAVGTVVTAISVSDLFFAALPGEGYPAIRFSLQDLVPAREHFMFGLANDQLGYLIAPEEGYPQVAAAAPDNDNALFNVGARVGDHIQCALIEAAHQIDTKNPPPSTLARCAPYEGEDHTLP
jgi:hypothetical protein